MLPYGPCLATPMPDMPNAHDPQGFHRPQGGPGAERMKMDEAYVHPRKISQETEYRPIQAIRKNVERMRIFPARRSNLQDLRLDQGVWQAPAEIDV